MSSHTSCYEKHGMLWVSEENQSSVFIEFFNGIGRFLPLIVNLECPSTLLVGEAYVAIMPQHGTKAGSLTLLITTFQD